MATRVETAVDTCRHYHSPYNLNFRPLTYRHSSKFPRFRKKNRKKKTIKRNQDKAKTKTEVVLYWMGI
ncbi:hypothetical protein G4B88_011383 [Cannabis sativa]|uniref:Uncharacterized protein n=1 Tax=Cannabis sativa TaxID=3483 RepID=A0A7J6GHL7_CANSA|nr:hypothetical protein G4B88_011383 [Cannabis sativa]